MLWFWRGLTHWTCCWQVQIHLWSGLQRFITTEIREVHGHVSETRHFLGPLKGIVHPKIKVLSSYSSSRCFKPFLCSIKHKIRYFKECWSPNIWQQPLTSIVLFFLYYGRQWLPLTVWLTAFFKISWFVDNRTKKLISLKETTNNIFGWTIANI